MRSYSFNNLFIVMLANWEQCFGNPTFVVKSVSMTPWGSSPASFPPFPQAKLLSSVSVNILCSSSTPIPRWWSFGLLLSNDPTHLLSCPTIPFLSQFSLPLNIPINNIQVQQLQTLSTPIIVIITIA